MCREIAGHCKVSWICHRIEISIPITISRSECQYLNIPTPHMLSVPGYNIGGKTLFSEWGKLPLKLTCLASTSTCPATLLNKDDIRLCPKHYLPSGASQGLVQLAPLLFLAKFTCNLQRLCCTLCAEKLLVMPIALCSDVLIAKLCKLIKGQMHHQNDLGSK